MSRLAISRKRVLFAMLAVALLALIGVRTYQTANGYCRNEGRYLTDNEYLNIAISLSQSKMDFGNATLPQEYLRQYPGCCEVFRPVGAALSNLFFYPIEIELNYRQRRPTNPGYPYYTQYVVLDVCGEYRRIYGESTATLKTIELLSK